jgi:hypothetical protein
LPVLAFYSHPHNPRNTLFKSNNEKLNRETKGGKRGKMSNSQNPTEKYYYEQKVVIIILLS